MDVIHVNPNDLPHVERLSQLKRKQRHRAGVTRSFELQVRLLGNGIAAVPVVVGLCTLLPWLGVPAIIGGPFLALSAANFGTAWISIPGYLEGVKCWDIANGYGHYYE